MTKVFLLAAMLALAGCATEKTAQNSRPTGLEPVAVTPSATQMGRDNPVATYQQPQIGPEQRLEPPPPPRRQ